MRTSKLIEILLLAALVGASFYQILFNENWQAATYFIALGGVLELEEWVRGGSEKR